MTKTFLLSPLCILNTILCLLSIVISYNFKIYYSLNFTSKFCKNIDKIWNYEWNPWPYGWHLWTVLFISIFTFSSIVLFFQERRNSNRYLYTKTIDCNRVKALNLHCLVIIANFAFLLSWIVPKWSQFLYEYKFAITSAGKFWLNIALLNQSFFGMPIGLGLLFVFYIVYKKISWFWLISRCIFINFLLSLYISIWASLFIVPSSFIFVVHYLIV